MNTRCAPARLCHVLRSALGASLALVLAVRGQDFVDAYQFTTLAGSPGQPGSTDGLGGAARFRHPMGIAVDGAGNVYVADNVDHTIRKITPAGWVTTLAGEAGKDGSRDGVGTGARFNYPQGVAVDAAGIVYVADTSGATIRRITPAGVVTTWAGRDEHFNLKDGPGTEARFAGPTGITIDDLSNVYVADTGLIDYLDYDSLTCTVRKITPGAVVTTLAGRARATGSADGPGAAAKFNWATDVAVDAAGFVYVADANNHTIRKVTAAGLVTTFAGSAGTTGAIDGVGSAARFSGPWGLAADSAGNVFVVDANLATIRHLTPAGAVTTIGGVPGQTGHVDGVGQTARFDAPFGIAVDPAGVLYIADTDNFAVRKGIPLAPVLTSQPQDRNTLAGQSAVFTVAARTVPAPSYQWQRSTDRGATWVNLTDDATYAGTTTATLALATTTLSMDGQRFRCVVTKPGAATTSNAGTLAVGTPVGRTIPAGTANGRLLNLSARAFVGRDDGKLIGGFAIADGPAQVIVRAIGPTLATLHQVQGALGDPRLIAFAGAEEIARNDDWADDPAAAAIADVSVRMGAFALSPDTRDAVLWLTLDPGGYTFHVDGADGGTGIALLEVYLVTDSGLPGRLLNLSARAAVGPGPEVLITGIVVAGATTALVRGIGPELQASFGLRGVLAAPYLDIFDGAELRDRVRAWDATYLPAPAEDLFRRLHAFPLARGRQDAIVLLTLPGGAGTVQLKGTDESAGIALAEIYLVGAEE